jgi:hypothetical protein
MCGWQGKTPGGIGFALNFLLLLFFFLRKRKVKANEYNLMPVLFTQRVSANLCLLSPSFGEG